MAAKYRILILTDHRIHSQVESIYAIARGLSQHRACAHVHAVSRGVSANEDFFASVTDQPLEAVAVDDDFRRTERGTLFFRKTFEISIQDYDVVFLRLPRVNSMDFFAKIGTLIPEERMINQPSGIALTGSKDFLLNFPDVCPPMAYCETVAQVEAFASRFPIVLKPLNNSGGRGILRIENGKVMRGTEEFSWDEYLPDLEAEVKTGYLGMKFLKNVGQGDKRVIVVNEEVVAAALRIPKEGSWLCNVQAGATSIMAEPDADEIHIAERIGPVLFEKGIVIFGFDTLMGDEGKRVLSEVNTSCINGILPAEIASGKPVVKWTVDQFWEYIETYITPK